jgi:hypothetical protein
MLAAAAPVASLAIRRASADLALKPPGEGSLEIRERVTAARKVQQERLKDQKIYSNAR